MATQTLSQSNANLLRRALQGDGLFSAACGLIFLLGAGFLASFMGLTTPVPLTLLGIGLLIYGAGLYVLASRDMADSRLPITVIALNVAWIVGSIAILAADLFGLTTGGRWLVLIVADLVAVFGIAEFVGLRRGR